MLDFKIVYNFFTSVYNSVVLVLVIVLVQYLVKIRLFEYWCWRILSFFSMFYVTNSI